MVMLLHACALHRHRHRVYFYVVESGCDADLYQLKHFDTHTIYDTLFLIVPRLPSSACRQITDMAHV